MPLEGNSSLTLQVCNGVPVLASLYEMGYTYFFLKSSLLTARTFSTPSPCDLRVFFFFLFFVAESKYQVV